jgi:hypothetical protein
MIVIFIVIARARWSTSHHDEHDTRMEEMGACKSCSKNHRRRRPRWSCSRRSRSRRLSGRRPRCIRLCSARWTGSRARVAHCCDPRCDLLPRWAALHSTDTCAVSGRIPAAAPAASAAAAPQWRACSTVLRRRCRCFCCSHAQRGAHATAATITATISRNPPADRRSSNKTGASIHPTCAIRGQSRPTARARISPCCDCGHCCDDCDGETQ